MKLLQSVVIDNHIHAFIELDDGETALFEADKIGKQWKDGLDKWNYQCTPAWCEKEIKHAFCMLVASKQIKKGWN